MRFDISPKVSFHPYIHLMMTLAGTTKEGRDHVDKKERS